MCTSTEYQFRKAIEKTFRKKYRKNVTGNISVKLFGFRLFFSVTGNAHRSKQLTAVSGQIAALINRVNENCALLSRKMTDTRLALPSLIIAFLTLAIGLYVTLAILTGV